MKNRKGFSLIELLGVLIIIWLILLVVLPIVSRLLTSNEKKQYMQYLDVIEKGAIRYADTLKDELGGYNNIACNEIDIVDDLIAEKFIKEYNDKKIDSIINDIELSFNELIKEIRKVYNREIYIIGYYDTNNEKYNQLIKLLNNIYKKNKLY